MTHEVPPELKYLQQRIGRVHLRQRLGIERVSEARVFGQGRNFFHIENWTPGHHLIKLCLQLTGLYSRGKRNVRAIEITHNDLHLSHLPAAFDGYRLLHISDSHLDMADDFPHQLIEAVRPLDYDICVWTGDFRGLTHGPHDAALDGLRQVRTHLKDPIYAILGNHDSIKMVPGIEALDIRMLLNEHIRLERDGTVIYLAGIDDPHYFRVDNFDKAANDIPEDAVSILLAHTPEVYRLCAFAAFDVMLCGHTHGGQICLPGGIPLFLNIRCPRRYGSGAWHYQQLQGYTSRGSGASVVDSRFNCAPEITIHHLRRTPDSSAAITH